MANRLFIPADRENAILTIGEHSVPLTNLSKVFWPQTGITKRDLLQYYADIATALLPHIRGKAMVLKRYPHGATGDFFFMKRAPQNRPAWIEPCAIEHGSGSVIDFIQVNSVEALLWVINLGCIDLNPWYAPCTDPLHPDYLHFDLDPFEAPFEAVCESALIVRDALRELGMTPFVKTSGGSGIHVYVPIVRGPSQKEVWAFAKLVGHQLANAHRDVLTAEYRIATRPKNRVLVDYNQNRFGATLASVYSVRPTPLATVSTPVTWAEVESALDPAQFTLRTVPSRIAKTGDLWKPLVQKTGRFNLQKLLAGNRIAV